MLEAEANEIAEWATAVGAKVRDEQDEHGNWIVFYSRKGWNNEARFAHFRAAQEFIRQEPLRMIAKNTYDRP